MIINIILASHALVIRGGNVAGLALHADLPALEFAVGYFGVAPPVVAQHVVGRALFAFSRIDFSNQAALQPNWLQAWVQAFYVVNYGLPARHNVDELNSRIPNRCR